MQFYILMIDYGRDTRKSAHGFGADVQPEFTRQNIVDQARDAQAKGSTIAFVKFIDGNYCEDVTAEILAECEVPAFIPSPADRIAFSRDRARDYAKHGETVA